MGLACETNFNPQHGNPNSNAYTVTMTMLSCTASVVIIFHKLLLFFVFLTALFPRLVSDKTSSGLCVEVTSQKLCVLKLVLPSWSTALYMAIYVVLIENELASQVLIFSSYRAVVSAQFNTYEKHSKHLFASSRLP